jgi:deoxyadenosine/deoxycytidine kinase
MVRIIFIEGNIGAGKSTVLELLKDKLASSSSPSSQWVILKEPVEEWCHVRDTETGRNILELYYDDPSKYATTFQNVIIQSKQTIYLQILKAVSSGANTTFVLERSFYSDYWVFVRMLVASGVMTSLDDSYFRKWFDTINSLFAAIPIHIVYIHTPVDVCAFRIRRRSRPGEEKIEKSYLESIEHHYNEMMPQVFREHRTFQIIGTDLVTNDEIVESIMNI